MAPFGIHRLFVVDKWMPNWKLTIFGRSLLLLVSELLANAACWVAAGLIFGRHAESKGLLSLAILAWVGFKCSHIYTNGTNFTVIDIRFTAR